MKLRNHSQKKLIHLVSVDSARKHIYQDEGKPCPPTVVFFEKFRCHYRRCLHWLMCKYGARHLQKKSNFDDVIPELEIDSNLWPDGHVLMDCQSHKLNTDDWEPIQGCKAKSIAQKIIKQNCSSCPEAKTKIHYNKSTNLYEIWISDVA